MHKVLKPPKHAYGGVREGIFPAKPITLVCLDATAMRTLKRYGSQILDDYGQADYTYFRLTTYDAFVSKGIRAPIWEAA